MITEDQLEQLVIQWHGTLTPALSHGEREEGRNIERLTSNVEVKR